MKKIIGFAGSPRVGGNSDVLLDAWFKGATEAGTEVEKIYLDQLSINPCRACDACRTPDAAGCIVEDDMQPLYPKLLEADVWVLATPVYWWGPSAQLKLMVDRWYGILKSQRSILVGKEVVLIITMGDDEYKTAHPTIDMFTEAFTYLKMKLHEPIVVTAHDKGVVAKQPEILFRAYTAGRSI